jgi:RNA polymerase sigma-70 factor (ECF subfamily)
VHVTDLSPTGIERRLIQEAGAGDRSAFMRLIGGHDEGLRSLAFRLLEDPDQMDDVLQDVYAKAFAGLPAFRRDAAVGTWLYRITYTTCIDRLRRRRRDEAVQAAIGDDGHGSVPDPAEAVIVKDSLARSLSSLPAEHRAAVLLIDRDGFDYAAAADILGIPMGTVASRVHAARAVLRDALRPTEVEESP